MPTALIRFFVVESVATLFILLGVLDVFAGFDFVSQLTGEPQAGWGLLIGGVVLSGYAVLILLGHVRAKQAAGDRPGVYRDPRGS